MARKYSGVLLVRQLLANRNKLYAALLPHHNLPSISIRTLTSFANTQFIPGPTPSNSKPFSDFSTPRFLQNRLLSSSPGSPSNIVLVKSEDELKSSLSKAQDGSLPAIFYFTAVWCGPCLYLQSFLELSEKYPHVTTYKIDIDEVFLELTVRRQIDRAKIHSNFLNLPNATNTALLDWSTGQKSQDYYK